MRNIFRSANAGNVHPKNDAGSGEWKDYGYDLVPTNRNTVIQLAESNEHQDELEPLLGVDEVQAFVARRTIEEERTDAPLPVRFFVDSRMTGIVGLVPRGLEPVVFEAMTRLESAGRSNRIPATVVKTRHGIRVNLLMGKTR